MKKFYVMLAVVVMVCMSSVVFAADVTVGGSVQVRSRDFQNLSFDKTDEAGKQVDTQSRVMIDINAKAGDNVKGKISLWNDFEDWGRYDSSQGNGFGNSTATDVVTYASNTTKASSSGHFGFREAWLNFNLPDVPVNVTAGHQLLQVGNGWFIRSKHYGADAWVVSNTTGNNTVAFVNAKITEGSAGIASDDSDAYVLLDTFKIDDNMSVGVDISDVRFRASTYEKNFSNFAGADLQNIGLNFNGKLGIVKLAAEVDFQMGKWEGVGTTEPKFKGNQIVIQGSVPVDPATINFLFARGSGSKDGDTDVKQYIPLLDIDPHYTFLYEYKVKTAAYGGPYDPVQSSYGVRNTGFANTTVLGAGAMFAASKSLNLGLDLFWLQATEKIVNGQGDESDEIGMEIDAKVYWKLYDNLSWNWDLGYFKPGKAYKTASGKTDATLGAQGILAFKF